MTLKEIEIQHFEQYKQVLKELIKTNHQSFLEEDIFPLFQEPPLDSMDFLKQKFLATARDNKLVIDSSLLSRILGEYRQEMTKSLPTLLSYREKKLVEIIDHYQTLNKNQIILIKKREYQAVDKEVRNRIHQLIEEMVSKHLIASIDIFFQDEKIKKNLCDYFEYRYVEQILMQFDSKQALKNNLLTNRLKEQGHRYLFTKKNSHLFETVKEE